MLIFLFIFILLCFRFKPQFEYSIKCELKWEKLNLMYHCLKDQLEYFNFQVELISKREKIKEQLDVFQLEFNERTE